MTSSEIVTVLECCANETLSNRKCAQCPLIAHFPLCHTYMCNEIMNYVISAKSRDERIHAEVERIIDSANDIRMM